MKALVPALPLTVERLDFLLVLLVLLLITEKVAEEQPRRQDYSATFFQKPN